MPPLMPGCVPGLRELRLHNGTVWRWNRPVYDVQAGCPQLRIENRVLPSGPTAVDMVANAAFYYGLVRAIVDSDPAPWSANAFRGGRAEPTPRGTGRARGAAVLARRRPPDRSAHP